MDTVIGRGIYIYIHVAPNAVFSNAGNKLLSIKKGYRYRVGPCRFCKVLANSEILEAAHK